MIITTIETIANAIDAKDEYTGGHSERVADYAVILATEVAKEYDLSEKQIAQIRYIARMHDIGKIGIPDSILNKTGKLTDEEYALMKMHTTIGDALLEGVDSVEGLSDGVRHHHERYDGKGYPDGLAGEEIPLYARILCLADCYDAMTSNRVYRKRLPDDQVRREIDRCAGTQFDPRLAKVFCRLLDNGQMRVATIEGLATNQDGRIFKSALIERMLDESRSVPDDYMVKNMAHIRMVSYIVKLSEKKQRPIQVLLFTLRAGEERDEPQEYRQARELLRICIEKQLEGDDISVEYSNMQRLVVLFDRDSTRAESLMRHVETEVDTNYVIEVENIGSGPET